MTEKHPEKTVDPAFLLDVMAVDALPGPAGSKAVEGVAVAPLPEAAGRGAGQTPCPEWVCT
jgi:hypothetical protein